MLNVYQKNTELFFSGHVQKCKNFFKKNNYIMELAYCYLIEEKIPKARELFLKAAPNDIRANWGLFLIEMITDNVKMIPHYMEIRSFLEVDLSLLLTYRKFKYIEKIITYRNYMANFNAETYKYIGHVFWCDNNIEAAMYFFNLAKDFLYNDPELHYWLAYIYYYDIKDVQKAKKYIDSCLEILPEYFPAENLKRKLKL